MISVVIPTLNEELYLSDILHDLKEQTLKSDEVIVVDAGSEDKTVSIAKKAGARTLISHIKNAGAQRNQGARAAKGEWILFVDADIRFPRKDTLERLLAAAVGAVAARPFTTLPREKRTWLYAIFVAPANVTARLFPAYTTRGGCLLIRKSVFLQAGGFNEKMVVAEDLDLGPRLRKFGKVALAKEYVYESDRRYKKLGYAHVVFDWWLNGIWTRLFGRSFHQFWKPVR